MSIKPYYLELADHYARCFEEHGAVPKGVDWPNPQDLETRFAVMAQLCNLTEKIPVSLLDLGCGYGAFLDYLKQQNLHANLLYRGIDVAEKMIAAAQLRWPDKPFEVRDILVDKLASESIDYVVMNGLFTEKRGLRQTQMEEFLSEMLTAVFAVCRRGIAFNVMSHHVDWFRDDLFHLPFDRMANIVQQHCSRHFMVRADYGLYEYTVYVYKQPTNQA